MPQNRIPLENFFRKPERIRVRVSPGGRHLAFMAPYERRLNVFVRDLQTGTETRVTDSTQRDIADYRWANDRRLVYLQDTGGDENYRLFAVSCDGTNPLMLTPFDGVQCTIVDELEEIDGEILFQMNQRDPEVFDVYRLNVDTGQMQVIAENPGNVQRWITDHDGRLRAAQTTDGVNTSILFRESETDEWRLVATYDFKESVTPLLFTFDNQRLYAASNVGRDKCAIVEFDPADGTELRVLFEHPEVDVTEVLKSRHRKIVTGVAFETDRRRFHYFDERAGQAQAFIDANLPGRLNEIISSSRDEKVRVVASTSDRSYGSYHLCHDVKSPLQKIFDISPWLPETDLAHMEPFSLETRDDLTLHGYLTLPPAAEPRNLPMVVNPHGGPWYRDSWGFNPEVQFLANRGFAVLQVNFRGSTGYGRRLLEASFGQWGLKMQDDVSAAVRWAIDRGIADPRRVAIYGCSYGGYAALAGLTLTPELYCCGVSYVGVSNLFTWFAAIPPYWKPYLEMMYEMIGHPEKDAERLRATSPLYCAEKIRVPLLVAQGANDPRVRQEESDQIVAALRARGVAVEYLVKENEGHGFENEENQFEFYRALEAFLEKHAR